MDFPETSMNALGCGDQHHPQSRRRIPNARILPLNESALSQIHSSKHIVSLQGVIASLLENSLDAGASKIDITVDFLRGCCTVEDNGTGIPAPEFQTDGGLAKLYWTSKRLDRQSREFPVRSAQGTFLAQLAALCFLRITSSTSEHSNGASVTWLYGETIDRRAPATDQPGPLAPLAQPRTLVEVRNLFGNMPVRVKQRALTTRTPSEVDREFHVLRRGLVALLLAWPKPCVVKLCNANDNNRVLNLSAHGPAAPRTLTERSLNQLTDSMAKFDLRDKLPLLFQAGLTPLETRHFWVPLSAKSSNVILKGLICTLPAPSRQCQFISIGLDPVNEATGHNELYECVNKLFANSSFGLNDDDSLRPATAPLPYKGNSLHQVPVRKQLQPRKGVDKNAMFCLNFQFDGCNDSIRTDTFHEESLRSCLEVLEAAVTTWLETHMFRIRRDRSNTAHCRGRPFTAIETAMSGFQGPRTVDEAVSPSVPQRESDLAAWSGVRRGRASYPNTIAFDSTLNGLPSRPRGPHSPDVRMNDATHDPAIFSNTTASFVCVAANSPEITMTKEGSDRIETLSSDDFGSIDEEALVLAVENTYTGTSTVEADGSPVRDPQMNYVDPVTKKVYKINARTGGLLPISEQGTNSRRPELDRSIALTSKSYGQPLSLARRKAAGFGDDTSASRSQQDGGSSWLPGFLKEWNNPVFTNQQEDAIPVAGSRFDTCDAFSSFKNGSSASTSTSAATITKQALRHAAVIGQVDNKFILCKIPSLHPPSALFADADDSTLVLVDQHAASERVTLEGLLSGLCQLGAVDITELNMLTADSKPLTFEISPQECTLLHRYREHFAAWGVLYDLSSLDHDQTSADSAARVRVRALPTAIVERCITFPRICIEMLRSEIWALDDGIRIPSAGHPRHTDHGNSDEAQNENAVTTPVWVKRLPSCPQAILEMLNSRACRSAIMFNDVLTLSECEALVRQLSDCVFPFMCAHGRVSMVPLAGLDAFGDSGID